MFFRIKVFRVQVFQGPRPGFRSNLRFFRVRVQVSEVPLGFSGSRFILVQVFVGPGFSGSGSSVRIQVLEVAVNIY